MSDYVPLGVFWLSLAIVTAGLAEQKHRSRWYWFLWGLLLGPLATALVVVWPSRAADRTASSASTGKEIA